MFSRWGAFVYRFRRPIVLVTIALALLSSVFATKASGELSSALPESSASHRPATAGS